MFRASNNSLRAISLVLAAPLVVWAGCEASPVVGGTAGVLLAGGEPLCDVQVTVHESKQGSWQPIGFADTSSDGSFRLLLNQASGPLELPPGDYRFTLESVGAPLQIPKELTRPETTPLKTTWEGSEPALNLTLPKKPRHTRW